MTMENGFPKSKTALLVIDPVNDFLSEGGAAWELTKSTVKLHDVVGNLKKAIQGARISGIPVIFGPMAYTEEDYANEELQKRSGINRIMFERKMFLAGSWGADFHPELQPEDNDIILQPHKGCDVFQTDLPDHLMKLGIHHLVLCGMTANLCCESTGRHATEAGYDVTFLYDAIGSENVPSYEAAVNLNYPLIGNAVIKVEEFLKVLSQSDSGNPSLREGLKVRGSDHLEIGKVSEVRVDYLLVRGGLIFKHDIYVPIDAITKQAGDELFVNVPRLVVGKMPWDQPPSAEGQKQKYGPPLTSVAKLYRSRSPSAASKSTPL